MISWHCTPGKIPAQPEEHVWTCKLQFVFISRTDGGPPPHKRVKEGEEGKTDLIMDKPARMGLREQSAAGFKELESSLSDGLVIVCKQHPSALLTHLMR